MVCISVRSFSREGQDFVCEDGYGSYSPYSSMQDSFSRANQLSTVVESQKQLMVMFKDLTQRIGTLENTVSDLISKVDSGSSTSTSNEEKMRIPSVLTVRCFEHA